MERLTPVQKRLVQTGAICFGIAGTVYGLDCWHSFKILNERKRLEDGFDVEKDKDLVDAITKMYKVDYKVKKKDFDEKLKAEQERREMQECLNDPVDQIPYKIQRESILFLGGGRAALLQLAHPFVAHGIAAHSNLGNGVQERFFRTFKYMFRMMFGDIETAIKASKTVRGFHTKVKGKLGENVGMFDKDYVFDAEHAHALLWVHMTLVDSSLFMYELYIERLCEREKDEFILATNKFGRGMFGIPDELLPKNYKEFEKQNLCTTMNTDVIQVSSKAQKIDGFLWNAPTPLHWPLLALTRWQTFVILPERLQEPFYGRRATKLDMIFASLLFGWVRFVYRLLPSSFRWLTAYLQLERRRGVKRSMFERFLSRISALITNFLLRKLMPPRKPLHSDFIKQ